MTIIAELTIMITQNGVTASIEDVLSECISKYNKEIIEGAICEAVVDGPDRSRTVYEVLEQQADEALEESLRDMSNE